MPLSSAITSRILTSDEGEERTRGRAGCQLRLSDDRLEEGWPPNVNDSHALSQFCSLAQTLSPTQRFTTRVANRTRATHLPASIGETTSYSMREQLAYIGGVCPPGGDHPSCTPKALCSNHFFVRTTWPKHCSSRSLRYPSSLIDSDIATKLSL